MHDRADFAQEFLRRSPAYRSDWATVMRRSPAESLAIARDWGLVILFDPDRPVRTGPAIWRLDSASQVVPLTSITPALRGAGPMPNLAATAELRIHGQRHLVIDSGGFRHRFELDDGDTARARVILLEPYADALRVTACDAARRLFCGLAAHEIASGLRPSALQRRRLALLLQMLDAAHAGASLREIGTTHVYPWTAGISALAWKASSERRRTQRLLAEARTLVSGGYRRLLQP